MDHCYSSFYDVHLFQDAKILEFTHSTTRSMEITDRILNPALLPETLGNMHRKSICKYGVPSTASTKCGEEFLLLIQYQCDQVLPWALVQISPAVAFQDGEPTISNVLIGKPRTPRRYHLLRVKPPGHISKLTAGQRINKKLISITQLPLGFQKASGNLAQVAGITSHT